MAVKIVIEGRSVVSVDENLDILPAACFSSIAELLRMQLAILKGTTDEWRITKQF